MFNLQSPFIPTGDQPQAIDRLVRGVRFHEKNQVLLGVTGSGKTFTIANVIKRLQMPALIISHNKTLAGQIYQEMREFFPTNAVSYFVSYYDFYQPEAYIPQTDTYIEKEAEVNELIDKLRLQATTNIQTRNDTIVVASVSCIYNIGSPQEYAKYVLDVGVGQSFSLKETINRLAQLQYERSEFEFKRGSFRVRGEQIDIYPAYEDIGYRVFFPEGVVKDIVQFDILTGRQGVKQKKLLIFPAKHFLADPQTIEQATTHIEKDMKQEVMLHKKKGNIIEAQRLQQRVKHDVEMIKEVGYVNGIENYSRYFDGRKAGDPPYSLLHYFRQSYGNDFLVIVDESHMTIPQIRGMYHGDFSRKKMLVDFGFRLRAAFDNRPMKFDEFYSIPSHIIYTSATPDEWELSRSLVVEQLVRPTGIVDPEIQIRPSKNEVEDLVNELEKKKKQNNGAKALVTTLTKRIAEDLTRFLVERGIRATYLHSDIETLERSDILDNLRKNEFDVLIGVNLLREGIDLPEVDLVAILDADKEGFLRSRVSLIQTMGRAARNTEGKVIMYADVTTDSMKKAIEEIERRRTYQREFNRTNNIVPKTISKPIREKIINREDETKKEEKLIQTGYEAYVAAIKPEAMTAYDKKRTIKKLEREMKKAAEDMHFEAAILLRDTINTLKIH